MNRSNYYGKKDPLVWTKAEELRKARIEQSIRDARKYNPKMNVKGAVCAR